MKEKTTFKRLAWQIAMLAALYFAANGEQIAKNGIMFLAGLHWVVGILALIAPFKAELPESYLPKWWSSLFSTAYIGCLAGLGMFGSAAGAVFFLFALQVNKSKPLQNPKKQEA